MRSNMTRRDQVSIFLAAAALSQVVLTSCTSNQNAAESDQPVIIRATPQPDPTDLDPFAQAALDLQSIFSGLGDAPYDQRPQREKPSAQPPVETEPIVETPVAIVGADQPEEFTVPPVLEPTPTERRIALLAELTDILAEQPPGAIRPPVLAALELALIETLEPGTASEPLATAYGRLTPNERRSIDAALSVLVALRENPSADPATTYAALTRALDTLSETVPLTIRHAVLCSRVESFGRYTTLNSNRFLAGRPILAILYVEVDGFTQKPANPDSPDVSPRSPLDTASRYEIEVTQELSLFPEHDPSHLAWRASEQVVRDTTRGQRRDYFLVQRLELPRNLPVGKYLLQVTVRDRNAPGSQAQTVLPLQVVADATIVASPPNGSR